MDCSRAFQLALLRRLLAFGRFDAFPDVLSVRQMREVGVRRRWGQGHLRRLSPRGVRENQGGGVDQQHKREHGEPACTADSCASGHPHSPLAFIYKLMRYESGTTGPYVLMLCGAYLEMGLSSVGSLLHTGSGTSSEFVVFARVY